MAVGGLISTASQAMTAHSEHINQIGINIANMNTTSYKEVRTSYQTLMTSTSQSANHYSVKAVDARKVDVQGLLQATGRQHDLAINGNGFFVSNTEPDGSGQTYYTRDGGFVGVAGQLAVDADGDGQNDQATYLATPGGNYLMGWPVAADGSYTAGGAMETVRVSHNSIDAGTATTAITLGANVSRNNGDSKAHTVTVPAISSGPSGRESHNLPLTWTPISGEDNAWTLSIPASSEISAATVSPSEIYFKGDGTLDKDRTPDEVSLSVDWVGADPSTISLDISGMTQFTSGIGFEINKPLTQNGQLDGRLNETEFDADGMLWGTYSNGIKKALYKLPIATFAAPNHVEAQNGNNYLQTAESGPPTLLDLDGPHGVATIAPGSLEASTVNLEDQFTRMMTTQKAYSSAATIFRTGDEMLQEARNLKR